MVYRVECIVSYIHTARVRVSCNVFLGSEHIISCSCQNVLEVAVLILGCAGIGTVAEFSEPQIP